MQSVELLTLQRRSLAPSQILKRKQSFAEEEELGSRRKQVKITYS